MLIQNSPDYRTGVVLNLVSKRENEDSIQAAWREIAVIQRSVHLVDEIKWHFPYMYNKNS